MAEAVKVSSIKLVNPFCRRTKRVLMPALDNKNIARVSTMKVNQETLQVEPVFESVDVQAEIQSCKDLCGLEYMKKLLASGQITAEDLQDNAGAEIDLTAIPQDQHEALRKANQVNEQLGKLAASIGCEEGKTYSSEEIERMLTAAIQKQYDAQQAAAAAAGGGENK